VRLTVLGSQGTWPGASRECCGYLLTADGFNLWLDAGTGTFARLQEHLSVGDLGGLLISHGHADHFLDIIPAFYARHYGGLGTPGLPFHSPPGFTDLAALLVSEAGRNVMGETYDFTKATPGGVFEVGPFRVTPYEMTHIGVPSLGYKIEADGKVLVLVTLNGTHVVDKVASPVATPQRLELTMVRSGSSWLASEFVAVGVQ